MTKNQWSGMIIVVVVLSLAVGFMGGSLYEKRQPQSILNGVDNKMQMCQRFEAAVINNDDEMQRWLRQCATSGKCVIEGKIE